MHISGNQGLNYKKKEKWKVQLIHLGMKLKIKFKIETLIELKLKTLNVKRLQ
jgi:hypothetical protein